VEARVVGLVALVTAREVAAAAGTKLAKLEQVSRGVD